MPKLNISVKFLLLVVIILLVGALSFFGWQKFGPETAYYAVFLQTGDLYFGQLSHSFLPRSNVVLKDVYLLRQNPNDQQNPLSLQKFSDAFWGPANKMKLRKDKIVWINRLRNDSQVVSALRAAAGGVQQFAPQAPVSSQVPPAAVPQQLPQAPVQTLPQ